MRTIDSWVIGGSSGIGKACAELLASTNRNVLVTDTVDCDVTNPQMVKLAAGNWKRAIGTNEYVEVVYSAGVNELEWIGSMWEGRAERVFDVNVIGFLRVLDALMVTGFRNVRVVAISSDAANRPMRTSAAYCASKAALDMAVKCAAREMATSGYLINAVSPGMTQGTKMTEYIDETVPKIRGWTDHQAKVYEMEQAVIKRRAFPSEIASVVKSVLEAPYYLNGAIIPVNGGR